MKIKLFNKARIVNAPLTGNLNSASSLGSSKYYRILATDVSWNMGSGMYPVSVHRLSLYESSDNTGIDLALNGTASASSQFNSYYNASAAVDGLSSGNGVDTGAAWVSARPTDVPQWLSVILSESKIIKSATIVFKQQMLVREWPKSFVLQKSIDGIVWETISEAVTTNTADISGYQTVNIKI